MRKLSCFLLALALSASGCKSEAERTCERYFEIAYLDAYRLGCVAIDCDRCRMRCWNQGKAWLPGIHGQNARCADFDELLDWLGASQCEGTVLTLARSCVKDEAACLEKHKEQVRTNCPQPDIPSYANDAAIMQRGSEMDARMYRHYLKHNK